MLFLFQHFKKNIAASTYIKKLTKKRTLARYFGSNFFIMKNKSNLLFICSVNHSRSPTAERIFADDPRFNVASAGTGKNAAVAVDADLLEWADWVIVMEAAHKRKLRQIFPKILPTKKVASLDIPDVFYFMEPALVDLLREKLDHFFQLENLEK